MGHGKLEWLNLSIIFDVEDEDKSREKMRKDLVKDEYHPVMTSSPGFVKLEDRSLWKSVDGVYARELLEDDLLQPSAGEVEGIVGSLSSVGLKSTLNDHA